MEPLSRFRACSLTCRCLACGADRAVDGTRWLPHLPPGLTLAGLPTALLCTACPASGSLDIAAAPSRAIAGGRRRA